MHRLTATVLATTALLSGVTLAGSQWSRHTVVAGVYCCTR